MHSPENNNGHTLSDEDIQRWKSYFDYDKNKSASDELRDLYATGDTETFNAFVDDLTYELLADNDDFMKNAARMRSGLATKEEQLEIRKIQRTVFDQKKHSLLVEAGIIKDSEAINDFDFAKQKIHEIILQEGISGNESEDSLLQKLGIISFDDEGNKRFEYPENLFPASTNKKWGVYLESVRNHIRKARGVALGTLDKHEAEDADKSRRSSHNAISRDIHDLLGLDLLPDSQWDFEKTRRLVAKMRELRFPNNATAEEENTSAAILEAYLIRELLKRQVSKM